MTNSDPFNLNFSIKRTRLKYNKRRFCSEGIECNRLFFPFSSHSDWLFESSPQLPICTLNEPSFEDLILAVTLYSLEGSVEIPSTTKY